MTRIDFIQRLTALNPDDDAGMTTLAQAVMNDAREPARAAMQLRMAAEAALANKAAILLSRIEEAALIPLLEPTGAQNSLQAVWLLRVGVNVELELRKGIVKFLHGMLDDKRRVPIPKNAGPMEETPPPLRVCDEAYMQMRRVLNLQEKQDQYFMNTRAFLNLPEAKKNEEIQKAKQLGIWTQLVEEP